MSNINLIQIFNGINDNPIEATAIEGCNGSAIVYRVNRLIKKVSFPFATIDDTTNYFNRYLDTVGGDDANDGLTPATAFKTWDRAIEEFKNGQLTDNYSTYLYVKGTLQCPLDCRGLYPMGDSGYSWGVLQLDRFPNATENFTIQGVTEADIYISRRFAITEGYPFALSIYNADIVINEQLDIGNIICEFSECKFIQGATSDYYGIVIGQGKLNFLNIEIDCTGKGNFAIGVTGSNSSFKVVGNFTFTGATISPIIDLIEGGNAFLNCSPVSGYPVTVNLGKNSIAYFNSSNTNWIFNESGGELKFINEAYPNTQSVSLYIPSPGNGTYPIWHIHNTCKLKSIVIASNTGSGDFRTKVNSDYLHTAESYTFSSFESPQIKDLDTGFYVGAINTNKVYLEITNASSLGNVFVQLIYGTFN